MSVNDSWHPSDVIAHEVIRRVCGIPADRPRMTNTKAVTELKAILNNDLHYISDEDDAIIVAFLIDVHN